MALWIMGFGGTVPFGGLAGGRFTEKTSIGSMVLLGAVVALALARSCHAPDPPRHRLIIRRLTGPARAAAVSPPPRRSGPAAPRQGDGRQLTTKTREPRPARR